MNLSLFIFLFSGASLALLAEGFQCRGPSPPPSHTTTRVRRSMSVGEESESANTPSIDHDLTDRFKIQIHALMVSDTYFAMPIVSLHSQPCGQGTYDPPGNFHFRSFSCAVLYSLQFWHIEGTKDDETQDGNILGAMLQVCPMAACLPCRACPLSLGVHAKTVFSLSTVSSAVYIHGNWKD